MGDVGNEKKADMAGAMDSKVDVGMGKMSSLAGARQELADQHPIPYYDHGPHHGHAHHRRHQPVTLPKGMK